MPRLLNIVLDSFKKGLNQDTEIGVYNQHMRSAEEIMKDYGLGG